MDSLLDEGQEDSLTGSFWISPAAGHANRC